MSNYRVTHEPNYLREWRLARGWSQRELSLKVGMCETAVAMRETNQVSMSEGFVRKVAAALDIRPGWLFDYPPSSRIDELEVLLFQLAPGKLERLIEIARRDQEV